MARSFVICFVLLLLFSCSQQGKVEFQYPRELPQVDFATTEITKAYKALPKKRSLTVRFEFDPVLGGQSYLIKLGKRQEVVISGGDETGLMYGGLELAEMIAIQNAVPDLSKPIDGKPYIKKRGLKFNIPLDIRTPSYQDAGDAAQHNIAEMWNFDFWKEYLDMMARNRYNVLTLWNPHPFPSMIKNKKYLEIALKNVCGTTFPLDVDRLDEPTAKFIAGCGISKDVLDNLVVLKKMTMDEKIRFWRDIMKYAKARGVEVYFITWNIWMNSIAPPGWYRGQKNKKGDEGKYGINNDQDNPKTIAYLREAVKDFILTYPDLEGIGVTAGENMEDRDDQYNREKWLWATYGEGILDAKKIQPTRQVKFIHRYWQSGLEKMEDDFISKYPDEINLSFKYARARMYATPAPHWADKFIKACKAYCLTSWWNIRNDDIFYFRWGDPEYASEFMKHLPAENVTAGYFMGSDGYVWGREFISKHPQHPRELEIDKHWYNFMLWGRMGYNPNMPTDEIKGMIALKYPGTPVDDLYKYWAVASRIPSMVTRFHWNDWDFMWAVEGCLDLRKGFHTVEDFINKKPMDGSGILSIPEAVDDVKYRRKLEGITPIQWANKLDSLAALVLPFVTGQRKNEGAISGSYDELIYDLEAWSWMGKYYASKIRAAYYLHAFREGVGPGNKARSVSCLKNALGNWKKYAAAASRNYNPQFLAKTRTIDWNELTKNVKKEIVNVGQLKL